MGYKNKGTITTYNSVDCVYLKGDETTDGSIRFIQHGNELPHIEERIETIWQDSELQIAPSTLWLGKNVGLSAIGSYLAVHADDGHMHFYSHSEFDPITGLTIKDAQIINAYDFVESVVFQSDFSNEWTGTAIEYPLTATGHNISKNLQFKTGSTMPSAPVRYCVWEGADKTGKLIYDRTYPVNLSPPPDYSDVSFPLAGYTEFHPNRDYYFRIDSDEPFSMMTNSGGTIPYIAADITFVRQDTMLQTKDWVDGDSVTAGDYLIKDRKIYICNTTGVQSTSWEANSALWGLVGIGDGANDRIVSADGDSLIITDTNLTYTNDGNVMMDLSSSGSDIFSPGGNTYMRITNSIWKGVYGTTPRIYFNSGKSYVVSPNGDNKFYVTDTTTKMVYNDIDRVTVDVTDSTMFSPDVAQTIAVNDTGAFYNNSEIQTEVDKGVALGIVPLNSSSLIDETYLPAYVDDVLEKFLDVGDTQGNGYDAFYNEVGLTTKVTEESSKIYIDITGGGSIAYRWTGTVNAQISSGLVLGETSATAYRGDRGAIAYTHSQAAHDYAATTHVHNEIEAPDTLSSLILSDTTLNYTADGHAKIFITPTISQIIGPNNNYKLSADTTHAYILGGGLHRLSISSTYSTLLSPDASKFLRVDDTGAFYNGNEVATIDQLGGGGDTLISPDTNSNVTITNTDFRYTDSFAAPRIDIDATDSWMSSPDMTHRFHAENDLIEMTVLTAPRFKAVVAETTMLSPDGNQELKVDDTGAYYNGTEIATVAGGIAGTVVSSVSWNANTTAAGEATIAYRTNHLKAFRLAPGIWSIENTGTNPLMPGDSADWVTNSIGGGIGDPFFLAEMNIVAFGQPSVGHPVTMVISATSLAASPNTGNLGSMIVKIKDKDGVLGDPTLGESYATVKLTYIV